MNELARLNGFLFDLDGSIYMGESLLPGAAELLQFLTVQNKKVYFITNNSSASAYQISQKLNSLGIKAGVEQIISPAGFAGEYIVEKYGCCKVFVIGTEHLQENVKLYGHQLCFGPVSDCDIVLVGRDLNFDYKKLEAGVILLQKGARLVAANLDGFHPVENGLHIPETGALIASIQKVVRVKPEVIGKPSQYIFNKALQKLGISARNVAIVGDNPRTDIFGGARSGLYTIWLRNNEKWCCNGVKADLICCGLGELKEKLEFSTIGVKNND